MPFFFGTFLCNLVKNSADKGTEVVNGKKVPPNPLKSNQSHFLFFFSVQLSANWTTGLFWWKNFTVRIPEQTEQVRPCKTGRAFFRYKNKGEANSDMM